jgi:hypothetical protein
MRTTFLLLTALAFDVSIANGQTRASDGVQAFVRGDYETAARVLRPLAENALQPDPTAQFFLAVMYESARGVPRDILRACSLYQSVAQSTSPFAAQSRALADAIFEQAPGIERLCIPATSTTFSQTILTIGQNHVVKADESGVTVSHNGLERRTKMQMALPGWTMLPVRHLAVDVTSPAPGRRHFIDFLIWHPSLAPDQPGWGLAWALFEVIDLDVVSITGDFSVLTSSAPKPPVGIAPESVTTVRTTAAGETEWVVLTGPKARSGVIPSKAPR